MKNVLITGSSRGIGKAISEELSKQGFNCICPSSQELNLNNSKSIENFFKNFNHSLYGLINNAGINILSEVENIEEDDIEKMISTNLTAPLKLIKYASKSMKQNKQGKIVNISSIWGIRSKEFRTLYSMTKFGINGITKSLSRELGPYNIQVNSVAPGYVNTEMTKKNVPLAEQMKIKEIIPLKRFAEPKEIAQVVAFLLSGNSDYVTGQTIIVDGGFLA